MPTKRRSHSEIHFLSDEELLDTRICDLDVSIEGTVIEDRIAQLYDELDQRGIKFRPHFWVSDEWFSPDGIPGIAIPFSVVHPRLARLERKYLFDVEGATHDLCMKILRHEAGHALDTAYRLRRRKGYREAFGKVSIPYPTDYHPKPFSRKFVLHLDLWYAQSHPVEDFAETFAVWLRPRSRWKAQYRDWPALKKLNYVSEVMEEIKDRKPMVTSRATLENLRCIKKTLREHYEERKAYYEVGHPSYYDSDLLKIFSDRPEHAKNPPAAAFLRSVRVDLRDAIARWTGEYPYTINQDLTNMIERCRDLKLRLSSSRAQSKRDLTILLTVQTMNYRHQGYHRVAL